MKDTVDSFRDELKEIEDEDQLDHLCLRWLRLSTSDTHYENVVHPLLGVIKDLI